MLGLQSEIREARPVFGVIVAHEMSVLMTSGNLRLLTRLLTQIERVLSVKDAQVSRCLRL
jgi:hypothetical protein